MGTRARLSLVVAALVLGLVPLAGLVSGERRAAAPDAETVLGRLPLAFEENVGQLDPSVRFAARTPGQTVLLTDDGLVVSPAGVRIRLEGAAPGALAEGEGRLPGTVNRLTEADPTAWRTAIPTYQAVTYRGVYPGIDVTYYGAGRLVEHDFVVAPGADPSVITLAVDGRIDRSGALVAGDVSLRPPVLYQEVDGSRQAVAGRYRTKGDGRFGFEIGPYDRTRPLVIDPVLVSSSYLGGTSTDTAYAIAVDLDGNIVVTGYTESPDFPVVSPAQAGLVQNDGTRTDVFVTKVKADGGTVLWSTYLGGRGRDAAFGVAVGPDTGVWVTGYTESSDFPTMRPLQPANAGASDVFVAKLNPAGSALEFSTFLGGVGADSASGIAVDRNGAVVVVGSTGSTNFPKVRPIQPNLSRPDDVDGFALRLEPNGASLAWSTYLGGAGDDHVNDVALDGEGNVYVTGDTKSANFPTAKPFQAGPGGAGAGTGASAGSFSDAFVAKIKGDGSSLLYSSYLGGADSDKGTGIAVDSQGAAYVTGNTGSNNFPVAGAAQSKKDGDFDAFVTKVRPDGTGIAYSTYLGGTGSDGAEAIAVDAQGHAHVTGATASSNFPSERGFQAGKGGGFVDAFVTEVAASGSSWVSSSYLGGKDDDQAAGIALDPSGNAVVVGYTNSGDFPVLKAFQPGRGGGVGDAFIAKAQRDADGGADGAATAAERRERRIKTLITVTGGLFLAAFLQGVWLRRRPDSAPRPAPRPSSAPALDQDEEDELLAVPGLQYVPRRGPPGLEPVTRSVPTMRATWGDDEPAEGGAGSPLASSDDWPQRPAADRAEVASRMAAPDLWARSAGEGEGRQSSHARTPGRSRPRRTAVPTPAPSGLEPADVWGPLHHDQDPAELIAEWSADDLLTVVSQPAPEDPGSAGGTEFAFDPGPEPEDKPEPSEAFDLAARRAVPPPPAPAPAPVLPPAPLPPGLRPPEPAAPAARQPDGATTASAVLPASAAEAPAAAPVPEAPASPDVPSDSGPTPAAEAAPTDRGRTETDPPDMAPDAPGPPLSAAEPGEPGEPGEPAGPEPSTLAAWATGPATGEHPAFQLPPGEEGFAAAAATTTAATAPTGPPGTPGHDEAAPVGDRGDLSLNELLAEDLPIPETAQPQPPPETEKARVWIRDLLDEDMEIPDPTAVVSGTSTDVPEPEEDVVPPPPSRLLTNLFEPDPDDPLVRSLRAREVEEERPAES